MAKYQAYFADADGGFTYYRAFACNTDEQAIEWTKQLMDQRPTELWCGARVVKRLDPPDDRLTPHYSRLHRRGVRLVPLNNGTPDNDSDDNSKRRQEPRHVLTFARRHLCIPHNNAGGYRRAHYKNGP